MSASVFTGWRTVKPGACTVCGCTDDWECDGRGSIYCSCQCCAECGEFDGHAPECGEPEPDDDTPLCNCGTCSPPDFTCIRED